MLLHKWALFSQTPTHPEDLAHSPKILSVLYIPTRAAVIFAHLHNHSFVSRPVTKHPNRASFEMWILALKGLGTNTNLGPSVHLKLQCETPASQNSRGANLADSRESKKQIGLLEKMLSTEQRNSESSQTPLSSFQKRGKQQLSPNYY